MPADVIDTFFDIYVGLDRSPVDVEPDTHGDRTRRSEQPGDPDAEPNRALADQAVRFVLGARMSDAWQVLEQWVPADDVESVLHTALSGWCKMSLGTRAEAKALFVEARDRARRLDHAPGIGLASTLYAFSLASEGRTEESMRVIVEAVGTTEPRSNASFFALLSLARVLAMDYALAAADSVLAEAAAAGPWPADANDRLHRRLARVRLESGDIAEATRLLAAHDRPRHATDVIEHLILQARVAAAATDVATARRHYDTARSMLETVEAPFLYLDLLHCDVLLAMAAGDNATAATRAIAAWEAAPGRLLATQLLMVAIEAFTRSGDLDAAWHYSSLDLQHMHRRRYDLYDLIELQRELDVSRAQRATALEIEAKNRRLRSLQDRASAVLSALAHGVRDPMTVFSIWLHSEPEEVRAHDLDAERSTESPSRQLEAARVACERVEALLTQVVWLARVEEFDHLGPVEPFDAHGVVASALEHHRAWSSFRELRLNNHSDHQPGAENAPPLIRALVNAAVAHAVSYSPLGGEIDVAVDLGGATLVIETTDDGAPPVSPSATGAPTRVPIALPSRRTAGGDPTGDIALLVVEAIVDVLDGRLEMTELVDGRVRLKLTIPRPQQLRAAS